MTPPHGVQVVYYSQTVLALDYARRTGARLTLPTFLMDREAERLSDRLRPAGPGGALKGQSPASR